MSLASKLAVFLLAALPVSAATILYDFATPSGDLGVSHTYTVGGVSIIATAFGPNIPHLFGKNLGGDEAGLGLTNDLTRDNEISNGSFIQLDLSNLAPSTALTIRMNSTTSGEGWTIYNTVTAGSLSGATLLLGGSDMTDHILSPTQTYLDFTVPANTQKWNVLLAKVSFDGGGGGGGGGQIPEPATYLLLGTGLAALPLLRRKLL